MTDFVQENTLIFIGVSVILVAAAVYLGRRLRKMAFPTLFLGLIGLIFGLALGALASGVFRPLPGIYGQYLPFVVQIVFAVAVADLFIQQAGTVGDFLSLVLKRFFEILHLREREGHLEGDIMLDTSSLIDGRIEEIVMTGFLGGRLIVPRFVLDELQQIADSAEAVRRSKGRRGLEVLTNLRKSKNVKVEVLEEGLTGREKVDTKLVKIGKAHRAKILTLDYNLNQVASISGVRVLNINELAHALRPALVPGEGIQIKVIQKGKEKGQGVGFLPDGTMIVVEGGEKMVGDTVDVEVERIFQTVAGKMIFTKPKK